MLSEADNYLDWPPQTFRETDLRWQSRKRGRPRGWGRA